MVSVFVIVVVVMFMFMVMVVSVNVVMFMFMVVSVIVFMSVYMIMVMFTIMVVSVFMPVFVPVRRHVGGFLFLSAHGHAHVRAGNPALHSALRFHGDPGKAQGVHLPEEGFPVLRQFQQRGGEHVPGGAHIAFKI